MSQLIDVTPGTRKSILYGILKPASSINGIRKPPTHESTCTGILYLIPSLAISSTGSITPCGKLGAEATSLKKINN